VEARKSRPANKQASKIMPRVRFDIWRRLRCDEGGNVVILFGAIAIPLLLAMGGAVDLARHARYKTVLANAVDSAALALGRKGEDMDEEEAEEFVQEYVAAFTIADDQFEIEDFDVQKTDDGFIVRAEASMETIFLPLGDMASLGHGINTMAVNLTSEVVHSSNRVELALVLDNTGSMNCTTSVTASCAADWSSPPANSRIKALKTAAKTLVDTLMRDDLDDKDQIKIALVPFEGMVNVASPGFSVTNPPSWIDWQDQGKAKWNGANFALYNFGGSTGTKTVGHKFLFNKLTAKDANVKWAGCVEMRAGAYELSDDAPNTSVPDSLYVPFFHPDEPDSNNDNNDTYLNNYLNDQGTFTTGSGRNQKQDPAGAQKSLTKYTGSTVTWHSGKKDTEGLLTPYEYGPNKGCPRPIYPLANANSKAAIKTQLDGMIAYWSTGTFIPSGLIWGWHVLSPGIPYTEGTKPGDEYYEETVKAIVLLTDGENDVTADDNHNKSRYSSYNYVATTLSGAHRLGSNANAAISALDTKTASLCTNVKNAKIRLYTITFGNLDTTTRTLMQNCATVDEGEELYYHAPTSADLDDIFERIGKDLSRVHLSM
jgi:Flp pilus assembly protein TadG